MMIGDNSEQKLTCIYCGRTNDSVTYADNQTMCKMCRDRYNEIESERVFICKLCHKIGQYGCLHQQKFKKVYVPEGKAHKETLQEIDKKYLHKSITESGKFIAETSYVIITYSDWQKLKEKGGVG